MVWFLAACTTPTPAPQVQPTPTPVPEPTPPVVGTDPLGTVDPQPETPPSRVRRRMDIDQLDASLRQVTGVGWDVNGRNQFEELSATLGVPDYVDRTVEDLSPGLLFQKFLDDAANHVCQEVVDTDFAGETSVLLQRALPDDTRVTSADAIDADLADALVRFHSHTVALDDPQLDTWRYLFDSTLSATGGDTMAAWRSVCIALIVHPDFYQY